MSEEILAKLNKLKREGGVGYTTIGPQSFTFDGDMTGKTVVDNGNGEHLVKVSDATPSMEELVGITIIDHGGRPRYFSKNEITLQDTGAGFIATLDYLFLPNAVFVLNSVEEPDMNGTWVFMLKVSADEGGGFVYTSKVDFRTETIHPIDPKYLPASSGGGLPVVELSTFIPFDEPDGVELTAEENAKLNALNGMPCILLVKGKSGANFQAGLLMASVVDIDEGIYSEYSGSISMGILTILGYRGTWTMQFTTE